MVALYDSAAGTNAELAASAGLLVDNGIVVDQYCRTADPLIFAAGEVTSHFNALLGRHVRVESWQVAENQPAVAAANMLGGEEHYAEMPWFWSDQYDCNLQTLGIFAAHQSVFRRGNLEGDSFCMLALGMDGRLEAAVTVNCGREVAVCRRLMAAGKALEHARLAEPDTPLKALLKYSYVLARMRWLSRNESLFGKPGERARMIYVWKFLGR